MAKKLNIKFAGRPNFIATASIYKFGGADFLEKLGWWKKLNVPFEVSRGRLGNLNSPPKRYAEFGVFAFLIGAQVYFRSVICGYLSFPGVGGNLQRLDPDLLQKKHPGRPNATNSENTNIVSPSIGERESAFYWNSNNYIPISMPPKSDRRLFRPGKFVSLNK